MKERNEKVGKAFAFEVNKSIIGGRKVRMAEGLSAPSFNEDVLDTF